MAVLKGVEYKGVTVWAWAVAGSGHRWYPVVALSAETPAGSLPGTSYSSEAEATLAALQAAIKAIDAREEHG